MSTLYYIKQTILQKGGITNSENVPTFLLKNFHDLTKTQSFSSQWWLKLIFSFRMACIQGMTVQTILTLTNALTYPFFPFQQCCQPLSAVTVHFLPVKKRIKINSPLPSHNLILLFGLSASSHTHTPKSRQNKIHVHKITHSLLFQVLLVKD